MLEEHLKNGKNVAMLDKKRFTEYLNENGIPFSEAKISTYIRREKNPQPDLMIGGKRYWKKESCKKYILEKLEKRV
ncbi:hypothetical protein [Pseudogracilibacillus sp. SO30301A]|uniref:hypothetical protein n=1 Tax=Pseudogracilibacillus sp. SO30301A TaxID=3098291 RepID=UPI00300E314F